MRRNVFIMLSIPLALACGGDEGGSGSGGGTGTGTGSSANCMGSSSWTLSLSGALDDSATGCLVGVGSGADTRVVSLSTLSGDGPTVRLVFEAPDGTTGSVAADSVALELEDGTEYLYDPGLMAPNGGVTVDLSRNDAFDDIEGTFSGTLEHLADGSDTMAVELSGAFAVDAFGP